MLGYNTETTEIGYATTETGCMGGSRYVEGGVLLEISKIQKISRKGHQLADKAIDK